MTDSSGTRYMYFFHVRYKKFAVITLVLPDLGNCVFSTTSVMVILP